MRAFLLISAIVIAAVNLGCGGTLPSSADHADSASPVNDSSDEPATPVVEAVAPTTIVTSEDPQADPTLATPDIDAAADKASPQQWRELFDGVTMDNFKVTQFGGEGDVSIADGALHFGFGQYMTGVTYDSDEELPKVNYELQFEAQRVDGFDFFSGVTFQVKDAYCSFIVGGWGGSVVGISSIDDMDASENETTEYITFKNGQWYKFRVRVTTDAIECWIDEKRVVNVDTKDRKLSTRIEVDLCIPLGFCCFSTQAALRNIWIRELKVDELAAYEESK